MRAQSLQLCLTLCDPMDCSPPGSSVHGILQAGILEWVATSFSRGSSRPRDRTQVSRICRRILYQLSHKGSPRILEWVAYPFSRRSSRPRNRTRVTCIARGFLPTKLPRKPSGSLFFYPSSLKRRLDFAHTEMMEYTGV